MFFRFHCVAMKCFREKLVNSSEFRSFMNETKRQTSGIGSLGDANILTLPLQRLSIYPILLGQVKKTETNRKKFFFKRFSKRHRKKISIETI